MAARAGVATPSLYKHVGSLAELRSLVSLRGWQELTEQIAGAVIGRSGEAALRGLLLAYRSYVVEHPLDAQVRLEGIELVELDAGSGAIRLPLYFSWTPAFRAGSAGKARHHCGGGAS